MINGLSLSLIFLSLFCSLDHSATKQLHYKTMAFSQFPCPSSTAQATKPKPNDPRWEGLKDIIHQFYIVDDLTLDTVISLMNDQYGFHAK